MGIFDIFKQKTETRAFGQTFSSTPIRSYIGDVDKEKALNISSLSSGVNLISNTVAQLPIYLYKEDSKGNIKRVKDKREFLLNNQPNVIDGAYNFKKSMVENLLLYGKSYSHIDKNGLEVEQLLQLDNSTISIATQRDEKGYPLAKQISYSFNQTNGFSNVVQHTDEHYNFLVVDIGQGVLVKNGDMLKDIIVEEETYKALLENTAQPKGLLSIDGRLTEGVILRIRDSWQNLYGGQYNAGKTVVLEEGLKYQQLNPNNAQTMNKQLLDETNSKRIEQILNLPSGFLSNNATSRGIGEQMTAYLSQTISPILLAIENAIDSSMLLESEKEKGYFFRFDTSELVRATETEKIDNVVKLVESGIITINESRQKIDYENIERDYTKLSLGSVIKFSDGEIYTPNTDKTKENEGLPQNSGEPSSV